MPIRDSVPSVFKRPYLAVSPDATMMEIAPFMAIGPSIFVDGLVVTQGERPIGRITCKQVLLTIMKYDYPDWMNISVSRMMDSFGISVEMHLPLINAINIFRDTTIAFTAITKSGSAIASLSIRDILPIIANRNADVPLKDISSPLILFSNKTNLLDALIIMFEKRIRNIVFKTGNNYFIANDRKILEFLFSTDGRKLVSMNNAGARAVEIGLIDSVPAIKVNDYTSVSEAAKLLMDLNSTCLVLNDSMITPWDLVMKTIQNIHV